MMAALMQGSQDDFVRMLVNALPHIAISDERRVAADAAGGAARSTPPSFTA